MTLTNRLIKFDDFDEQGLLQFESKNTFCRRLDSNQDRLNCKASTRAIFCHSKELFSYETYNSLGNNTYNLGITLTLIKLTTL